MRIYFVLKQKIKEICTICKKDEYIDWLNSEESLELEQKYKDWGY